MLRPAVGTRAARIESPLLSAVFFRMVVGVHSKYVRCSKMSGKNVSLRQKVSSDGAMNTEYSRFAIKSAAHRSIANERTRADKDLKQINDLALALTEQWRPK